MLKTRFKKFKIVYVFGIVFTMIISFGVPEIIIGAERYSHQGDILPSLSNPSPTDNTGNVSIDTSSVSVDIVDGNGDTMTWNIDFNGSVDTNSGSDTNTTISCDVTTPLARNTTYTWYVNVSDGTGWTNATYTFTTENAWYVSNTGSDSNSGDSSSSPWKTLNYLNARFDDDTIEEGDDVFLKRGDTFTDESFDIENGGNSDNDMVIGAYGSGDKPKISISANVGMTCNSELGHVIIEYINITNCGSYGIIFQDSNNYSNISIKNIDIYNTTNDAIFMFRMDTYKIENCTIYPKSYSSHGITTYGFGSGVAPRNGVIKNCTIHYVKDGISFHCGDGGESESLGDNFWVENCTIYDSEEEGIDISPGINSDNYYIQNCEIYNADNNIVIGHGVSNVTINGLYSHDSNENKNTIVLTKSDNVIIRNSVIKDWPNGENGLVAGTSGISDYTNNTVIYNNDFITNGIEDAFQINYVRVQNFTLKNNIIHSTQTTNPGRFLICLNSANISNTFSKFSNNLWWRGDGGLGDDTWWDDANSGDYNWSEWENLSETTGELRQNASIENPTGNDFDVDFNLSSDSPCIDAGDWLTHTDGSGTSTWITVNNADYFFKGFDSIGVDDETVSGDIIFVDSDTNLEIIDINYYNNSFKVNRSITWADNENVSLSSYIGSAPDIGAFEYQDESISIEFISIDGNGNISIINTSTPTFNWTIAAGASQYHLQVATNSNFETFVVNLSNITSMLFPTYYLENTTRISFTLPLVYALPAPNRYYCRVRGYVKT